MNGKNNKLSNQLYVDNSPIHGRGLFTKTDIRKGSYLGTYSGRKAVNDGTYALWVETNDGGWVGRHGRNILKFLNHSETPSCAFDEFNLYALRNIRRNEELTIDYGNDPGNGY